MLYYFQRILTEKQVVKLQKVKRQYKSKIKIVHSKCVLDH